MISPPPLAQAAQCGWWRGCGRGVTQLKGSPRGVSAPGFPSGQPFRRSAAAAGCAALSGRFIADRLAGFAGRELVASLRAMPPLRSRRRARSFDLPPPSGRDGEESSQLPAANEGEGSCQQRSPLAAPIPPYKPQHPPPASRGSGGKPPPAKKKANIMFA